MLQTRVNTTVHTSAHTLPNRVVRAPMQMRMRGRWQRVLTGLLASAVACATAHAQQCRPQRTGLVLSGGGAKGFAHVGVFRILDSLHIRPDFIVGSSIGAIAGALYASGYTGVEIDSLTRALPIANVIRSYSPVAPGILGALPAIALWENRGFGFALQTGTVREAQVNALMSALMLRGNLLARGDFDRLPIPLRVVATRLSTRKAVVLSSGDLAQAMRASFAIPLIFSPGVIGNSVLMDGGIADNIPVDIARAMGADRLIVSMLPSSSVKDDLLGDPLKVALQLTDYLFVNDTGTFRPQDLIIRNKTDDVSSLDFSAPTLDSLVQSGMREARATFKRAGCVQTIRGAAEGGVVPAVTVPTLLSEFRVHSSRMLEEQTLRNALGLRPGRAFREDSLRNRLLQLGDADDYDALWLTPSGKDTSVTFDVTPVYGAREAVVAGFAYDNDLGGRLWGAAVWRDLFHAAVEGATLFDIGKYRQEFRAGLLRRIPAFQHAAPFIATMRTVNEDVRVFTDSSELLPVNTRELELAAGVSGRLPAGLTLGITPSFRAWRVGSSPGVGAAGLTVRLVRGSVLTAPTRLEGDLNTRFQRVHLESRLDWQVGSVEIVPSVRASWAHNAPLQDQFILGGYDGFPGLRTTERRAEQEAMAGIAFKRQAFGPVRAVAEYDMGAVGNGDGFLRRQVNTTNGQILTGVRLGGEMRISVLDVHVERGFNSAHGDRWFIRLGQWF